MENIWKNYNLNLNDSSFNNEENFTRIQTEIRKLEKGESIPSRKAMVAKLLTHFSERHLLEKSINLLVNVGYIRNQKDYEKQYQDLISVFKLSEKQKTRLRSILYGDRMLIELVSFGDNKGPVRPEDFTLRIQNGEVLSNARHIAVSLERRNHIDKLNSYKGMPPFERDQALKEQIKEREESNFILKGETKDEIVKYLKKQPNQMNISRPKNLTFHLSQTELIELVKALLLAGKIKGFDKDAYEYLSIIFQVPLKTNASSTLQQIKGRNNDVATKFLDRLKRGLLDWLER